jgi:hypothetical protein
MPHTHWDGGPVCTFHTKKACDEAYADAQADSQVALALRIIAKGDASRFKDTTVFSQLVQVLDGTRETITNKDGVEAAASFTKRLLAAVERRSMGE